MPTRESADSVLQSIRVAQHQPRYDQEAALAKMFRSEGRRSLSRLLLFEKPTHDRGCDQAVAHSIGAA